MNILSVFGKNKDS